MMARNYTSTAALLSTMTGYIRPLAARPRSSSRPEPTRSVFLICRDRDGKSLCGCSSRGTSSHGVFSIPETSCLPRTAQGRPAPNRKRAFESYQGTIAGPAVKKELRTREQALQVFGQDVDFQVDSRPFAVPVKRRVLVG